jgi:hypothetical protein
MLVARGQGLMAVINPRNSADKVGILELATANQIHHVSPLRHFSILLFNAVTNASSLPIR